MIDQCASNLLCGLRPQSHRSFLSLVYKKHAVQILAGWLGGCCRLLSEAGHLRLSRRNVLGHRLGGTQDNEEMVVAVADVFHCQTTRIANQVSEEVATFTSRH